MFEISYESFGSSVNVLKSLIFMIVVLNTFNRPVLVLRFVLRNLNRDLESVSRLAFRRLRS